eukprot:473368-Rhodomonas_salina.2
MAAGWHEKRKEPRDSEERLPLSLSLSLSLALALALCWGAEDIGPCEAEPEWPPSVKSGRAQHTGTSTRRFHASQSPRQSSGSLHPRARRTDVCAVLYRVPGLALPQILVRSSDN